MYCLRCGKETADSKVFCQSCLSSMENYPVKPGQPIVLPTRSAASSAKKSRRSKSMSNDELLDNLRLQVKRVGRLLLTMTGLLLVSILLLFLQWRYGLFLPN